MTTLRDSPQPRTGLSDRTLEARGQMYWGFPPHPETVITSFLAEDGGEKDGRTGEALVLGEQGSKDPERLSSDQKLSGRQTPA